MHQRANVTSDMLFTLNGVCGGMYISFAGLLWDILVQAQCFPTQWPGVADAVFLPTSRRPLHSPSTLHPHDDVVDIRGNSGAFL